MQHILIPAVYIKLDPFAFSLSHSPQSDNHDRQILLHQHFITFFSCHFNFPSFLCVICFVQEGVSVKYNMKNIPQYRQKQSIVKDGTNWNTSLEVEKELPLFLKSGKMTRLVAFNFLKTKQLQNRSRTDPTLDLNGIILEIISIQKKIHLNPDDLQDLRQILEGFTCQWWKSAIISHAFLWQRKVFLGMGCSIKLSRYTTEGHTLYYMNIFTSTLTPIGVLSMG